jgi:hypothetical protein
MATIKPRDCCGRCCALGQCRRSLPIGRRIVRFDDGRSYWFTFCNAHRDYDPAGDDRAHRLEVERETARRAQLAGARGQA